MIGRLEATDALRLFSGWLFHNTDLPFAHMSLWTHYPNARIDVTPLLTGPETTADERIAAVHAWADRLGAKVVATEGEDGKVYHRTDGRIGGDAENRPVDIHIFAVVPVLVDEPVSA